MALGPKYAFPVIRISIACVCRPAANRLTDLRFLAQSSNPCFNQGENSMSNFSQITKVAAALAALAGACGGGAPYAVNPTDPQIAHIAYTAGQIDIAAARTLAASLE